MGDESTAPDPQTSGESPRVGRPTKKLPKVVRGILADLRLGLSKATAAAANGVHRDTLFTWCQEDPGFSDDVTRAIALGCRTKARRLDRMIRKPESGHGPAVQGCLKFLATHDRESWSEKQQIEHSGSVNTLVEIVASIADGGESG